MYAVWASKRGNTDSYHQGVLWAGSCEGEVWEEEIVQKILLFSNPDQGEAEQKKKFVEDGVRNEFVIASAC